MIETWTKSDATDFLLARIGRKAAKLRRTLLVGDVFTMSDYIRPVSLMYLGQLAEVQRGADVSAAATTGRLLQFIADENLRLHRLTRVAFYCFMTCVVFQVLGFCLVFSGLPGSDEAFFGVFAYPTVVLMFTLFSRPFNRIVTRATKDLYEDIVCLRAVSGDSQ
jgi:hypothetical protein